MTLVVDASTVVAALVDTGAAGQWAEAQLRHGGRLLAPSIMPTEVANVLRRLELNGTIDSTAANLAFADLQRLAVQPISFSILGDRIWKLRHNLSSYDASYVAAAEAANAPLATLDHKLTKAPGVECSFLTPT